jgi:hypothetical protein
MCSSPTGPRETGHVSANTTPLRSCPIQAESLPQRLGLSPLMDPGIVIQAVDHFSSASPRTHGNVACCGGETLMKEGRIRPNAPAGQRSLRDPERSWRCPCISERSWYSLGVSRGTDATNDYPCRGNPDRSVERGSSLTRFATSGAASRIGDSPRLFPFEQGCYRGVGLGDPGRAS